MDLNVTNPNLILRAITNGQHDALSPAALNSSSWAYNGLGTAWNNFTTDAVHTSHTSYTAHTSSHGGGATEEVGLARKILLGIFFGVCILVAVIGNLLVCTAVFTERRLKRVKNNYFIVSLAVADLLVACVVMTFAMANDLQQQWLFGEVFCRIWICFDVMCSTASILNLCVISFDRFKHIHNAMYYDLWMTSKKALTFIASVWVLSALISFLPIHLGWHTSDDDGDDDGGGGGGGGGGWEGWGPANKTVISGSSDYVCAIKLNFVYAIVSSTISFYVPCLVMMVLYFKLFLFARSHAISIRSMKRPVLGTPAGGSGSAGSGGESNGHKPVNNGTTRPSLRTSDNKAAFTLGVITGVFLCCWIPFFVINPINAYNPDLIHPNAFVVSTWLGYVNSCLNPIIYSIFNTEFREAFKKILSLRTCRRHNGYFLPSSTRPNSVRKKFHKTDYESQATADNVSITCVRKTSRDHLFNEKITRL